MSDAAQDPPIGPTGRFPGGQLNEHDVGELLMEAGVHGDRVVLHFGETPIQALVMTPDEADTLADILRGQAAQARNNPQTPAFPALSPETGS